MEKVYQLMDLLDIHQSVDWLQSMTGKPLKESDLLKLCNAKHCNIYLVFRDEKIKDSTVFKRELYDLAAKVSSPVLWLTGDVNRPGFLRHFPGLVNVASQTLPVTADC
jgi:hypothetical protein